MSSKRYKSNYEGVGFEFCYNISRSTKSSKFLVGYTFF